jgi:hypothetical protein
VFVKCNLEQGDILEMVGEVHRSWWYRPSILLGSFGLLDAHSAFIVIRCGLPSLHLR